MGVYAQQPMGGCWHPEDITNWSPQTDPEAKFNRSVVALKPRFKDETTKAGLYNYYDSQVTACLIMHPMCSQTPAQGDNNFTGYTFNYWQYIDILVWWGGSAAEGVIIPPSAPVVDAAHKNGVQVYGNIFFPPGAFGGQSSWVREMLKVENGEYPYAKKLAEIANYFGFDGWFINEETYASSKEEWAGFAKTFNKYKAHAYMGLQWYDASTSISGTLFEGKDKFSSMFLNYGSASSSTISSNNDRVRGWDMNPFEVNYYGLEIGGQGFYHSREFKALFSKDRNNGSVALFCPEEKTWKDQTKRGDLTPYQQMEEFYNTAGRFWVNIDHDVTSTSAYDDSSWPGMSVGVAARSTILEFPFVTNFNTGMGKKRYVKGTAKGTGDWYHRGIQDILPTWRWWVEGDNKTVVPKFNWDDSYNSGACLMLTGSLNANVSNNVRLYKTKLAVQGTENASVVVKGNTQGYKCYLGLAFSEDNNAFTYIELKDFATGDWKKIDLPLVDYAGKTISMISVKMEASSSVSNLDLKLGQLFVGNAIGACGEVSNVRIIDDKGQDKTILGDQNGDARVVWDSATGDVDHYNIYLVQGGVQKLVGQTMDEAFYIKDIVRSAGSELGVQIVVKSVDLLGNEHGNVVKDVSWTKPTAPSVKIVGNQSYIEVGETVVFTARATQYPESYNWTLPDGAEKVTGKYDDNQIAYRFTKAGHFDISVDVGNNIGTTSKLLENAVTVVDNKELEVVSVGKTIDSFSGYISTCTPDYLIDGDNIPFNISNKWCVGGAKSQWVIIDLEEPFYIYGFRSYDTGHKEDASGNYDCWKIEVSNDKEIWTEVVNEQGRQSENTKYDAIAETVGRYVRFTPYDNNFAVTLRIWEFQVLGISLGMKLAEVDDVELSGAETRTISMAYDLGALSKGDDFGITAAAKNDHVLISNARIDSENNTFLFDIQSKDGYYGKDQVEVVFVNKGMQKSSSFMVSMVSDNWTNVALSKSVQAYSSDYSGNLKEIDGGENLVDDDVATALSASYRGVTVKMDLQEDHKLYALQFNGSNDGQTERIKVEGSNDGVNYTTFVDINDYVGGTQYLLPSAQQYRYLRILADPEGYSSVDYNEFKVYGEALEVSIAKVAKQTFGLGESHKIQIPFTNKVDFSDNDVTVSLINENLGTISNVDVDFSAHQIGLDFVAGRKIGMTQLHLAISVNGKVFTQDVDVLVVPSDAENVALNKTVVDFSGSTTSELPKFMFDGVTEPSDVSEKWCETGDGPHYFVIDLGKLYTVFEFKMFDAGTKEDAVWNSMGYTIEVSEDNVEWKTVAEDATDGSTIKDIYTNGVNARYVKYTTGGDDGRGTVRFFEFEVYGTEDLSTSTEDVDVEQVHVYPNPATDYIEVKGSTMITGASIKIFDLLGQQEIIVPNYQGEKINISHLPSGIHVMQIKNDKKVTYTKIMVL